MVAECCNDFVASATAAAEVSAAIAAGASAAKGGGDRSRTDGRTVTAYWTQVDGPPGANQPSLTPLSPPPPPATSKKFTRGFFFFLGFSD